jgi:hypothetical protein
MNSTEVELKRIDLNEPSIELLEIMKNKVSNCESFKLTMSPEKRLNELMVAALTNLFRKIQHSVVEVELSVANLESLSTVRNQDVFSEFVDGCRVLRRVLHVIVCFRTSQSSHPKT